MDAGHAGDGPDSRLAASVARSRSARRFLVLDAQASWEARAAEVAQRDSPQARCYEIRASVAVDGTFDGCMLCIQIHAVCVWQCFAVTCE